MAGYSTSIEILRPPEVIWPVLMDFPRWSEWTRSISNIEAVDGASVSIDSRWRISQPKLQTTIWTISGIEELRSFTWKSSAPGIRAEATHHLEPTAAGTILTLGITTGGTLAWLVALLYGKLTQSYIEMEAAGLKKKCESL